MQVDVSECYHSWYHNCNKNCQQSQTDAHKGGGWEEGGTSCMYPLKLLFLNWSGKYDESHETKKGILDFLTTPSTPLKENLQTTLHL